MAVAARGVPSEIEPHVLLTSVGLRFADIEPRTLPFPDMLSALANERSIGRIATTRLISQATPTAEARAHWASFYAAVAQPRTLAVSAEDARMCESQGSLAAARAHEHLLRPDADVHRMRQQLRAAYLMQQQGKRHAPDGATTEEVGVGNEGEEPR